MGEAMIGVRVVVVSETFEQAETAMRKQKLPARQWRYVSRAQDLIGITSAKHLIIVGHIPDQEVAHMVSAIEQRSGERARRL